MVSRKLVLAICLLTASVLFVNGLSILHYARIKGDGTARGAEAIRGGKTEGEGDGLVSKGDGGIGESTKKAGNKGINQQ
ncbi:MAG: hypothetical protein GX754_03115, partial [Clostridiaceae bacterium]|nr:hypothetical protein [Clostridiaceae bacterium]